MAREYTPQELGIVYPTDKEYTPAELGLQPTQQKEFTPEELGLTAPQEAKTSNPLKGLVARGAQLVGEGVECVEVAWPTRYTHSGVEVCSLDDLEQLKKLLIGVVEKFSPEENFSRG